MAGKYQHYIQQMIQKGFRRPDGSRRNPSVWVYTKGNEPYPKRIERFGGEDEFYSPLRNGQDKTLDDKITDWESHRQADVRTWRNLPHGAPVEASKAAELIGLTGARTKALRQTLQSAFEEFLPRIGEIFQDPDVLMSHIDDNETLDQAITNEILRHLGGSARSTEELTSSLEFKAFRRILKYVIAEVGGHALSGVLRELDQLFRNALEAGDFNVAKTHKGALERHLDDHQVRKDLLDLNWFIAENQTDPAWVLPDCAILQLSKDSGYAPFLFGDVEQRQALILPLTPKKALVGTGQSLDQINLSELTKGAISCCSEFFVASRNAPELEELSDRIGTRAQDALGENIDAALEGIGSLRTKKDLAEIPQLKSLNFQTHQLSLDEDGCRYVAGKIMSFINLTGKNFDVSRLTMVVLCSNVLEAVNDLEMTEEPPFSEGDVRQYIWWRELGEEKPACRLYIQSGAAEVLCNPDHEAFDFVLSLLLQSLAQLHVRAVVLAGDKTTSEILVQYTNPETGEFTRDVSIRSACAFMGTLYGCRIACADSSFAGDICDQLIEALEYFHALQRPITQDKDTNNQRSADIASAMDMALYCASKYLAICQYLNVSPVDGAHSKSLKDILSKHHLLEWFYRLDFDFQRLRVNFSHPLGPKYVTALQLHAERLLWGRDMALLNREEGEYIQPFADPALNFDNILSELRTHLETMLPDGLRDDIKASFNFDRSDQAD
ncbi:DUF4238 domain-containing protein [Kordiimonas aestuarii]|uniref:DUF4238 domain-containing protein n=1 Tax=Kordiimonas aestuarii TaxID=1005925 RepID=UPI0021D0DD2A|nr:DUF4238 domain-containing protein [Kordiimonas aestuarii]